MLSINKSYPCKKGYYGGLRNAIKYIVLHYTGNEKDTAVANAKYFHTSINRQASAHYFIDDNECYQSVEDNHIAWSVGGGTQSPHHPLYKICTNSNSISIEMCTSGGYEVSEKAENNAVELVKYLMNKYGVDISHVVRHYDVNGKACPSSSFRNGDRWDKFLNKVNGETVVTPTPTPTTTTTNTNTNSGASSNANKGNDVIKQGQQHSINFTGSKIAVDGIYGANTKKNGVKVLQHALNLDYGKSISEDGIAGAKTINKLGRHYVKKGEKQYMVTACEILLMLKGYNPNGVECPGVFGSGLKACVEKCQRDKGLSVDGICGAKTFKSLIS